MTKLMSGTMPNREAVKKVVALLSARNWVPFADLETETGLSLGELIQLKPEIEHDLRTAFPDASLVSRIDLNPPGFEVTS